ncbi:MAG: hypothetical protein ACLR53_05925 [Evtepia gabavorous]
MEKAHPTCGAFCPDHGGRVLTDAHGKRADFRNTVIVMTSNVGGNGSPPALGFPRRGLRRGRDRRSPAGTSPGLPAGVSQPAG